MQKRLEKIFRKFFHAFFKYRICQSIDAIELASMLLPLLVSICREAVHMVDNVVEMRFTDEHRCFVIKHY